jgi:hypothetical protein
LTSIGIVGAGRTRFGLGPVLAHCAERVVLHVAGVAGRTPERSRANADELARSLGHPVAAYESVEALCESAIDALIVASPPECHLHALEAAMAAGLAVLCEKPLVHEHQCAAGGALARRFGERGLPLMENCQWANVLPAIASLLPVATARRIDLGLEPPRAGREMIANSLSHLLSVVQVAMPFDASTDVHDVRLEPPVLDGRATTLRFVVEGARRIDTSLHLLLRQTEESSPWVAIDGERLDRRIDAQRRHVFAGRRGSVTVPEPIQARVDGFAQLVRTRDRGRIAAENAEVRERLRLYRDILACVA